MRENESDENGKEVEANIWILSSLSVCLTFGLVLGCRIRFAVMALYRELSYMSRWSDSLTIAAIVRSNLKYQQLVYKHNTWKISPQNLSLRWTYQFTRYSLHKVKNSIRKSRIHLDGVSQRTMRDQLEHISLESAVFSRTLHTDIQITDGLSWGLQSLNKIIVNSYISPLINHTYLV